MHFDQRTQRGLREVGLSRDEIESAAEAVVEETRAVAADLEALFEDRDVVYSDVDLTHSADEYPELEVEYLDLYTHGAEIRGWLRFSTWGVYVEDGRVLADDLVELTLSPSVHDRVRFATARDRL